VRGLTFEGAAIDNSLRGNGASIRDQSTGAASMIVESRTTSSAIIRTAF
jgi:hypothetical protein